VFISNAYAQGAAGGVEGQLLGFLPIVLMFVVLYFLMIRPQMKRAKDHKTMLGALQKGDEVITAGGLVGRVNKVGEGYVTVEVAHQGDRPIEMQFQKASVQTLLPKGTIKAI
jgi:preprotein translocase subunit YajC